LAGEPQWRSVILSARTVIRTTATACFPYLPSPARNTRTRSSSDGSTHCINAG
jgi:hypothetical protein